MRKLLLLFISTALLLPRSSMAQMGLEKYFNPAEVTGVDLFDFEDVSFNWDMAPTVQVELNEGINYLKEGDYAQSIVHLDSAIKIEPALWMAYYYRSIAHQHVSSYSKAEKDMLQCINLKSNVPQPYLKLGDIYLITRQSDKAEKNYHKSIAINPRFTMGYYRLGLISLFQNLERKAQRYFEQCLEIDPDFGSAYVIQGIMKFRVKRDDNRAIEYFNKAIEVDQANALAYFWRGLAYASIEDKEKCLEDFNRSVELNPNRLFFLTMRGVLNFELKKYDHAFRDLKKTFISANVDENSYTYKESSLDKRIDIQFAVNYMVRFSYGLPEEALLLIQKACCHIFIGEYKVALADLTSAQQIEKSSSVYFLKAVVFESLDKHDSAYHYYSKSLDIDPDIFDAYKKRAIYRSELKDWKGSYSDLKQMLRLQPESPAALRLSGLIKANLKDYFGAIIDITKFIKIDTTDFDMWRARAICRENIKDNAGAIKDYQTALDIRPKSEEILHSIKFNYLVIGDSTSAIKVALKIKSIWNYDLRVNVDLAEMYFYIKKTDSSWFYLQPVLDESKNPYSDRQLNSDALFIKGKLLLDQGKVKDGMNALNKSISIDSSDEKRYFRAITLLRRGNEEDALEDLRVLKKNNFKKADGLFVKYNIK